MNTRGSGFTLLEMTIAIALLGIALTGAAMVSSSGSKAHRANRAVQQLEQNLHRALERAAEEMAATGAAHLDPDPIEGLAYDEIDYQAVVGFTGTDPDLGTISKLVSELEAGEVEDGVDNDGDGLVDERDLVLIQDVGGPRERRVVLCHGVLEYLEGETFDGTDENGNELEDEPGFHFERNGNIMTLRLSIGGQDAEGRVLVRTAEIDTRMRN